MAIQFRVKSTTPGAGSAEKKLRNDRAAADAVLERIEDAVSQAVVRAVDTGIAISNTQKLYIAATFFQRVVARTPVDEEYTQADGTPHVPDEDSVRDDWYIAYGSKTMRSTQFAGCFDTVDDKGSIDRIARALVSGIKTSRIIRQIRIYNTNPRFSQLEYGEYRFSSGRISSGPKRKHGVVGGFSVQAPSGMLRITESEIDQITKRCTSGLMAKASAMREAGSMSAPSPSRRSKGRSGNGGKAKYAHLMRGGRKTRFKVR